MDDDLNKILLNRNIPPQASNLAYRINQMALAGMSGNQELFNNLSFSQVIMRLFLIPRPAYAMAVFLFIGLVIGLYATNANTTSQEWFSFLDIQEEEWL